VRTGRTRDECQKYERTADPVQKVFLSPMIRRPEARWTLRNVRSGCVLADRILPAFDSASRRRGLLGRDHLPVGHAMIIAPSNAIHTFRMRFAIDVAFVDRSGRVLKVRRAVPPWRMAAALRGFAVIELPAGTLERCPTQAGDMVAVIESGAP
jgi:uncharacterized protein